MHRQSAHMRRPCFRVDVPMVCRQSGDVEASVGKASQEILLQAFGQPVDFDTLRHPP